MILLCFNLLFPVLLCCLGIICCLVKHFELQICMKGAIQIKFIIIIIIIIITEGNRIKSFPEVVFLL